MKMSGKWLYGFLFLVVVFSCNSPKRQKKINDGKLFEKLKEKEGYLNAEELQRLERDFELNLLNQYDFSGYDELDTLAYYVRSGPYLWIASCYLGEDDDLPDPFFCLKEKERKYELIRKGIVPGINGECSYELENLLITDGKYIIVSQRSYSDASCNDRPLIFSINGKQIKKKDELFQLIPRNCPEGEDEPEDLICFERTFKYEFHKPFLVIHNTVKHINWKNDEVMKTSDFDLRFELNDEGIRFLDTLYK